MLTALPATTARHRTRVLGGHGRRLPDEVRLIVAAYTTVFKMGPPSGESGLLAAAARLSDTGSFVVEAFAPRRTPGHRFGRSLAR